MRPESHNHEKFTKTLFNKFLQSRPQGIRQRTAESYHYPLTGFTDYPSIAEAITQYLHSLPCNNGKLKFCSCLGALFKWLYQNGCIHSNPIKCVCPPKAQEKLLPVISKEQLEIWKGR